MTTTATITGTGSCHPVRNHRCTYRLRFAFRDVWMFVPAERL